MKIFALYSSAIVLIFASIGSYPSSALASTYGQDAYGAGMYQYGLPIPPPGQTTTPDQAGFLSDDNVIGQPESSTDTLQGSSEINKRGTSQDRPNDEDAGDNEDGASTPIPRQTNSDSSERSGSTPLVPLPSTKTLAIGVAVAASLLATILLVRTLNNRSMR